MSNERVILCGGLAAPRDREQKAKVLLHLWGNDRNVHLTISDISEKMVANIPPVLVDLLEVATYVYCADQATTRGGDGARNYGANWRRRFQFHIPVREPRLWSSGPVLTALCDTLGFLSDDEYEFTFKKLADPPLISRYLDFGPAESAGFQAEEVILFSGGIDSLGGAVQEALVGKRKVALVSHRSSPKIAKRQKDLLKDLEKHSSTKLFHVPVWINKEKALGKEFTQRTRTFLYAALATVVARIFDLWRIRFYENGLVSINLPISPQVVGGRATRTTHPQVINGFSQLLTLLFQKPFAVENPFIWMTKAQVVRSIRDAGCADLIKYSVSCTHVWEMTTLKTHCGECSQCIDRRFATLSAGCTDTEDPEEMYTVDLLRGERKPGESRTMLESYVRTAKRIKDMSEAIFFSEFGEVHRVTQHIKGVSVDEAASKIFDLYKRHASEVWNVITMGIQKHAKEISDGKVPNDCMLILALPEKYKEPSRYEAKDNAIIDALQKICPSAADSYAQGLENLKNQQNQSWRGTVDEFREALRETLDTLAPNDKVMAQPGFNLENKQSKPTMKQKAVFILKRRRVGSAVVDTAKKHMDLVEAKTGSFARSVYELCSDSTHGHPTINEAILIRDHVALILSELLEIHHQ